MSQHVVCGCVGSVVLEFGVPISTALPALSSLPLIFLWMGTLYAFSLPSPSLSRWYTPSSPPGAWPVVGVSRGPRELYWIGGMGGMC